MKRFTGYLRACVNPQFSGLARVVIQHHAPPPPPLPPFSTEETTCGCGLYIHPSRRDDTAIHCSDCPYAPKITKVTTCWCEAGFGVRQLVAALGDGRQLTKTSGEKKARWVIDDMGLLQSVEVVQ